MIEPQSHEGHKEGLKGVCCDGGNGRKWQEMAVMYSDMAGGYIYSMDIVADIAKVVCDVAGAGP